MCWRCLVAKILCKYLNLCTEQKMRIHKKPNQRWDLQNILDFDCDLSWAFRETCNQAQSTGLAWIHSKIGPMTFKNAWFLFCRVFWALLKRRQQLMNNSRDAFDLNCVSGSANVFRRWTPCLKFVFLRLEEPFLIGRVIETKTANRLRGLHPIIKHSSWRIKTTIHAPTFS